MPKRLMWAALSLACILAIGVGCSDDAIRGSLEPSPYLEAPVTRYFPIADGYSTQVSTTTADGGQATLTYEVGSLTTYDYHDAYPLRTYQGSKLLSTDYLVVTDSALFMYDDGAGAQKILDLPLRAGHTWQRNDLTELDAGGSGEDQGDTGGDDDLSTGDDGGGYDQAPMGFPGTVGQFEMTVIGRESVILGNGLSFSNVYRVRSQNASGSYNYYWYASGVGLVKYVINASPLSTSIGSEVGELSNYGIGLRK